MPRLTERPAALGRGRSAGVVPGAWFASRTPRGSSGARSPRRPVPHPEPAGYRPGRAGRRATSGRAGRPAPPRRDCPRSHGAWHHLRQVGTPPRLCLRSRSRGRETMARFSSAARSSCIQAPTAIVPRPPRIPSPARAPPRTAGRSTPPGGSAGARRIARPALAAPPGSGRVERPPRPPGSAGNRPPTGGASGRSPRARPACPSRRRSCHLARRG